jgi:hypothetical protein
MNTDMYELTIAWIEDGEQRETCLGMAVSLDGAEILIHNIERDWQLYCENIGDLNFLHESNPLRHYEGCDVFARNILTGESWMFTDVWEAQ